METIELIRKFRPIFVFHPSEKYYPINLKYIRENCTGKLKKIFKPGAERETIIPRDPLYYNILMMDNEELIVNYILIYAYSDKGFFGFSSTIGDIKRVTVSIDLKTKTLKKIFYHSGASKLQKFDMHTERPKIYVSLGSHDFSPMIYRLKNILGYVTEETAEGFRWDPVETQAYSMNKLSNKYLHEQKLVPRELYDIPF